MASVVRRTDEPAFDHEPRIAWPSSPSAFLQNGRRYRQTLHTCGVPSQWPTTDASAGIGTTARPAHGLDGVGCDIQPPTTAYRSSTTPDRNDLHSRSSRWGSAVPSGTKVLPRPWTAGYTKSRISSTSPGRQHGVRQRDAAGHHQVPTFGALEPANLIDGITESTALCCHCGSVVVAETTYFCT